MSIATNSLPAPNDDLPHPKNNQTVHESGAGFTRLAPEVGRILDITSKLNVLFAGGGSSHHEPYWNEVEPAFLHPIYVDPLPGADQTKSGQIIPCALSNTKGVHELFVCETPDASSLKRQNQKSLRAATFYHHGILPELMKPVTKITVETNTIDQLQSDGSLPRLDFIKLNVEGSELDVLHGGANALDRCLGIQTEVSFKSLWEEAPHFSDLDAFIRSRGFEFRQLLAPIHHGKLNNYIGISQEQDVRLYPYPSQQLFQSHVLYMRPDSYVYDGGKMNCGLEDALKLIFICEIYGLLEEAFYLAEMLLPFAPTAQQPEVQAAMALSARGYAAKYPSVTFRGNVP